MLWGAEEAQDDVRKLQIKNQRLELKVASNLRGGWAPLGVVVLGALPW